ncbi:MAG: hypothetical protein A2V90_05640 [Gammaproteobacteria bacterium RBG_16_57_12]|nr:MAG: hypothetical protein A2V90_05640 [Gammaproteobacteria bacterium RBG_16_57_12]
MMERGLSTDRWMVTGVLCVSLMTGAGVSHAEECYVPLASPIVEQAADSEDITISADEGEIKNRSYFSLQGGVELIQSGRIIHADKVIYDRQTEQLTASGEVHFQELNFDLTGQSATIDMATDRGVLTDVDYRLFDRRARGQAAQVELEGKERIHLKGASYTTCPPGQDDWMLSTRDLVLDRARDVGTAKHIVLRAGGVPVLYLPYLNFPLGNRKTGILFPDYSHSDSTGSTIAVPFYWNIAPHRDATITPRFMARRGSELLGEFRYLNPASRGQLNLEYLEHDDVYQDRRGLYQLKHQGTLGRGWYTDVGLKRVSDNDYLRDLGSNLAVTSTSYLEQMGEIGYGSRTLGVKLRAQDFQLLDTSIDPYRRLPQVLLRVSPQPALRGVHYDFAGEYVQFKRNQGLTGDRLDLYPALSYPLDGMSAYLHPRLGYRHTAYRLSDQASSSDDAPSRGLPVFSLDSGVFLERWFDTVQHPYLHSLEPRLYYLYVPYREQAGMIRDSNGNDAVFDTYVPDFSFEQMFRDNRFIGADRMGDANQATLALTSRLLDQQQGIEHVSVSIGRRYYLDDPRVSMPGSTDPAAPADIMAMLQANFLGHWRFDSLGQWDRDEDNLRKGRLNLLYRRDNQHVARLSFNYVRDTLKQSDLALRWPLVHRWSLFGRWQYSFDLDRTLEGFGGLEYNSCCWMTRIASRHYVLDSQGTTDTTFLLQVELKGLANVGTQMPGATDNDLFGY